MGCLLLEALGLVVGLRGVGLLLVLRMLDLAALGLAVVLVVGVMAGLVEMAPSLVGVVMSLFPVLNVTPPLALATVSPLVTTAWSTLGNVLLNRSVVLCSVRVSPWKPLRWPLNPPVDALPCPNDLCLLCRKLLMQLDVTACPSLSSAPTGLWPRLGRNYGYVTGYVLARIAGSC